MMRFFEMLLCLLCLTSFVGCDSLIYDDPCESAEYTDFIVGNVYLNQVVSPYGEDIVHARQAANAPLSVEFRFIIEVYSGSGKLVARHVVADYETSADSYQLNTRIPLEPKVYRMAIWADHVRSGTSDDLYYSAGNLEKITLLNKDVGATEERDAFTHWEEIDLRKETGKEVARDFTLSRPLGLFHVIATDLEAYLAQPGTEADGIRVQISYPGTIVGGYDAVEGFSNAYTQGGSFVTDALSTADNELFLGWDYLLGNSEPQTATLNINIYSRSGALINRIEGISFPYIREKLTTIRGKFLTEKSADGIGVITDYSGEFHTTF